MTNQIMTICPSCGNESLNVTIEQTKSAFNHEFGQTEYWFEGTGNCNCGYSGPYSDSSL